MALSARRVLAISAMTVGLLTVATLLVIHLPFVRARALDLAARQLASRWGLSLRADRLDYNLFTRDVTVTNVRLGAVGHEEAPFFTAARVHVVLPVTVFRGRFALSHVDVDRSAVAIRRSEDGTSNLPGGRGPSNRERPPFRLNVRGLAVNGLDFSYVDVLRRTRIVAGDLHVQLTPTDDASPISGPMELRRGVQLTFGEREIDAEPIAGTMGFDGSNVTLGGVTLRTSEGTVVVDGRVERAIDRPALDLTLTGDADVARAANWTTLPVGLAGRTRLAGTVTGPAAVPTVVLTTTAENLTVGTARSVAATAHVTITTDKVVVDKGEVRAGGGRLEASANIPFSNREPVQVSAAWQDLDGREATRLGDIGERPLRAALTGTLRYQRQAGGPLVLQISNRARALQGRSPGDVPLEGELALTVANGRWEVRQQHTVPAVLTVTGGMRGAIDGAAFSTATVDGRFDVAAEDIAATTRSLEALGLDLPAIAGRVGGRAQAAVSLAGRFDALDVASSVDGEGIRFAPLAPATVRGEIAVTPQAIRIANVSMAIGEAEVGAEIHIDRETQGLDGQVRVSAPDVAEIFGGAIGGIDLHGPATAEATLGGTTGAPQLTSDVSGTGLRVLGQTLDRVTARVRVSNDHLDVESFSAEQAPQGTLSGRGSYAWGARTYSAAITGSDLEWTGRMIGSTPSRLRITTLSYDGRGSLDRPGGKVAAAFDLAGGVAGTLVGEGTATAELTGERALVTVQVPGLGAFVDSSIATAAPYAYDAVGRIERLDLAALAPLADAPAGSIIGTVSLNLTANGTASRPVESEAFVNLQEVTATIGEVPVALTAPGQVSWTEQTLASAGLGLRIGQGQATAAFTLPRSQAGRWDATFDGQVADLVHLARPFGAPPELDASGRIVTRWQTTGGLPGSAATFDLSGGTVTWGELPPVTALAAQATYDGRAVDLRTLTARWSEGTIEATATIPQAVLDGSSPGPAPVAGQARARVDRLPAAAFAPWVGAGTLGRIQGELSASLDATFDRLTADAVQASLTLDAASYVVAGVDVQQVRPTRLTLGRGAINLDDVEWTAAGSPVTLTGRVDLAADPGPTLDLGVNGDVSLRLLAALSPTLATEGMAAVDLRAVGPARRPTFLGRVDIRDGGLALRDPRVVIGQVAGTVILQAGTITVDNLIGVANGGDLNVQGRLVLDGTSIRGGQLVAQAQRLALEYPRDLQSEFSALATLTPGEDAWTLGGDVRIERSAYTEPISIAALVATRRTRPAGLDDGEESWLERMRLNLFVVTEEDLRLDNNYGRVEAGAAVRLVGTIGSPGLTGRVTFREGGQFYLAGNTFYVERGSISFSNPNRIEPEIDLQARGLASGRDIRLIVSGTPTELKTDVQPTDPTMTSREARESLYGGLVGDEQALTLLSGELLGVTGRALGLDALRLERGFDTNELRADPTLIATETDPSTRLTLSKRLSPLVEVILSQSLSESGALSAIVSYKPRRNVEVRATSRDNIDRSISVRHEVTFGGGGTVVGQAAAQPRVSAVRVLGTPGRPAAEIRRELRLDEGDRFDFHRWQTDVDGIRERYLQRGFFEARVRATRTESEDDRTVALDYTITRGPRTTISVQGYTLPGEVLRALEDAWARTIFDQFLVDEVRGRIERQLFAENWVGSTIDARVVSPMADEKQLRISVSPGQRVSRHVLRFAGNRAVDEKRLREEVARAGLRDEVWIEPTRASSAVEAYYHNQGYLSARATTGEPTVEGDAGVLIVLVEEGARFTVASADVTGAAPGDPPVSDLLASGLPIGAPYDPGVVDRTASAVERVYRRLGYNDIQIEPAVSADSRAATVSVAFAVERGPQQVLREVSTDGATRTSPEIIRRALRLRIGQPVDLEQWSQARKRMYDTNVFRQVDIEPIPLEATEAEKQANVQPVRAVVRVIEYPEWRLRYGGQYREEKLDEAIDGDSRRQGLGILADLQNQNLFGRAITAGTAISYQPSRQATSVFASNGSFFGLPVRSNLFLFNVHESDQVSELLETVTDRRGVSLEQRWRPFRSAEVTYGYRYEWTHLYEPNPNPLPGVPSIDNRDATGRIRSAFFVDRRNDPFNAAGGFFSSINFDKSAALLGSTAPSTKMLVQQFLYKEIGRVVLAWAGRVGVAYDVQNILTEDRFLAGGGTTVRGYAEDGLGPRDILNRPSGGASLLVFNHEVRLPVTGRLGAVAFLDAGNVWSTRQELSLRDLEVGYGFGLRVNTPFALLRVDYGIPGNRVPSSQRRGFGDGRWYFGIGQIF